ncbi:PTS fructose transporter subunit IIC [Caldisalinibacter kiritimatiensis]|uniref:PTS system, fructose-specific component IIB / IIC n=1 Tax=Caldisalinibacter kiritimatiensis TaxID=1304284 RepID=R1CY82_9FIRM|nr:PTS fructose transporter subunit IIC [Caldisalinibacter kiritimatiensis]EOD01534.1 PTS system, fructose-specific component IIB / IIC [Caldisalinibacter kiritimatiensis]
MGKAKNLGKELQQHLMTGVSYMIPFVAAAGLMLALSSIIGKITLGTATVWLDEYAGTFANTINKIGGMGFSLLIPIIAGYISYSVADKPGIAPGMIGGVLANQMKAGFIGGIVVGLFAGYLVKWMKENIKLPVALMPLLTIILIPLGATLIVTLVFYYVIGEPIAGLMAFLENWLKGMQGGSKILLGVILGAMMAFDMGGPLNKTAVAFAFGMYASNIYEPNTAIHIAVSVPPLGMWLATKLAPKKYSESEITAANPAAVMAIFGITEGTIPFAMADPFRVIPAIMIGTATATGLAAFFDIINPVTLAFFLSWPFVNKPILYGVCMIVGMLVTALVVNALKPNKEQKEAQAA